MDQQCARIKTHCKQFKIQTSPKKSSFLRERENYIFFKELSNKLEKLVENQSTSSCWRYLSFCNIKKWILNEFNNNF